MNQHKRPAGLADVRPMIDEADIGSGEKHPAQMETEEMIRQIPPLPEAERAQRGGATDKAGDGAR